MAWCVYTDKDGHRVDARTGYLTERLTFIIDPKEVEKYYAINLLRHGSVVRPRYLSLLDYSTLPDGAIELYGTATRKDVDILRDQLLEFGLGVYSSDQINVHIYTIRDRLTSIPCVLWGSTDSIIETVATAKAACQGASVPVEQVTIAIIRSVVVEYLISQSDDPFITGALRGLSEYPRMASEQASATIKELDYAIECGQKAKTSPTVSPCVPFIHLDKPGVHQYLEQEKNKLTRTLRSIVNLPQLQSLPTLLKKVRQTMINDEVIGMLDLELLPWQSNSTRPVDRSPRVALSKDLFTCPITLNIMENPATTTPCEYMFEFDAISAHLRASENVCPICRAAVTNTVPNSAFKNVIEAWSSQQ